MLKATTLGLLAFGLAAGLSMTSADAATHARVNCSLARNANVPACQQAAQTQMAPDVAHTGAVPAGLANPQVKLDCNNVPQNSLEYYCNHRDEFPN